MQEKKGARWRCEAGRKWKIQSDTRPAERGKGDVSTVSVAEGAREERHGQTITIRYLVATPKTATHRKTISTRCFCWNQEKSWLVIFRNFEEREKSFLSLRARSTIQWIDRFILNIFTLRSWENLFRLEKI